jgi:hypothetical protein
VIPREYPLITMPVLPRRGDENGEPVEELTRCEFDDAVGSRPCGSSAAAGPDPGGGDVHVELGGQAGTRGHGGT